MRSGLSSAKDQIGSNKKGGEPMGYLIGDGANGAVSPLRAWFVGIGIGVVIMGAALSPGLLTDRWARNTRDPARLRATAPYHVSPVVPDLNFTGAVESRKALLAAEGRDLDLRVVVEASLMMSADEVAGQATELAKRLRCGLDVRYKGQTVRAWPGMSRENFTKQYVEQVEAGTGKAGPSETPRLKPGACK